MAKNARRKFRTARHLVVLRRDGSFREETSLFPRPEFPFTPYFRHDIIVNCPWQSRTVLIFSWILATFLFIRLSTWFIAMNRSDNVHLGKCVALLRGSWFCGPRPRKAHLQTRIAESRIEYPSSVVCKDDLAIPSLIMQEKWATQGPLLCKRPYGAISVY